MTNPLKGQVEVSLGTETYKCRLTIDSLVKIENELDMGILGIATKMGNADVRIYELSVVLRYALRGGGNDIDQKEIFKIIEDAGIVSSSKAVAQLLADVLSDPNEKKKQAEAQPQMT
tara:strand:- start:111 stop:461 length:351 start_codon:yes stop_codon:yes gene_type:complete